MISIGVNGAHQIEQGLLAGLPGAPPAALIQDATLPTQCHTVTALAELHATLVREQFGSPCVIVVGDVLQGLLRLQTQPAARAA